jgi:hypothetical protein
VIVHLPLDLAGGVAGLISLPLGRQNMLMGSTLVDLKVVLQVVLSFLGGCCPPYSFL